MSYAIRFLPIDPADVSPALYLSDDVSARLTSVAGDVWAPDDRVFAARIAFGHHVGLRCTRERLRADVVPLADALADLAA